MKTKILPSLFFLFFSHLCYSQNFAFIPDSNASWTISIIDWGNYNPQNPYGVFGDTVIEANIYHKIHQSTDSVWNPINSTYFCAVRQFQDKWIFVPQGDTTQYLLYDFSASIGDTIQINNPWASGIVQTEVIAIDSVLLQGVYRKRISVNSIYGGFPEFWIEGIGSSVGLFYTGYYEFDYGHQLLCFHENDTLIYLNAPNNDCGYRSVGISENELENEFTIFPNPTKNEFYLKINNSRIEVYSISIYLPNGKLVERIINIQPDIKYNLTNFSPGIYFLKLENNISESTTQKLIIK